MDPNRKYFGMTPTQLGILGGLAAGACLLFMVAGWLFLDGGSGLFVRPPESTPIPQATATLIVIPTSTATVAPTAVPYEMLIPEGWMQFKTALVEIWLPEGFKVAKNKTLKNSTNLAVPELVISEVASKSSLHTMLAVVSYEPMVADSLDAYLTSEIANLPPGTRVADKRMVTVNAQNAVRFVFETHSDNTEVNDLMYVFLDGSTVWYVEYVAEINEYFTMLDAFEKSARTFRIVR